MSAKDDSEKILREIHVLLADAEPYEKSKLDVIVNKREILDLLDRLTEATSRMPDERELTLAERDKAYREDKRKGEEIISKAKQKAEDIYAASVIYTDRSLEEIQNLVKRTSEEMDGIYRQMKDAVGAELRHIRNNQTELHGQLQDLADTQKYLRLIEEENRRIAKEKEKEADLSGTSVPASSGRPVSQIQVNPEYFKRRARMLAENETKEEVADGKAADASKTADADRVGGDSKASDPGNTREDLDALGREMRGGGLGQGENTVDKVLKIFRKSGDS